MPTTRLNGRALDVRPDRVDLRDYSYRPPLVSLPDAWPPRNWIRDVLPAYCKGEMVLNQCSDGACTGFGLAAVVNYLKWERWQAASARGERTDRPQLVSARMLFQNARLYDEWQGEDYHGSSCRGAMKGFHKHGVCSVECWPDGTAKEPGTPREGWEESAAQTPLGAYYRIETDWIVALQAAVHEAHAVYASASVHDGWEVGKQSSIEAAIIRPAAKIERGGHAFAIVGYRAEGFIVQNSWGPGWGCLGFAILPYEEWLANAYDAWVLALGAPVQHAAERIAVTTVPQVAGAGQPGSGGWATTVSTNQPPRWNENAVARHALVVGQSGRPVRHLVEAADEADTVRKVVAEGLEKAKSRGFEHVAIYAHGGLNARDEAFVRVRNMGPWLEANGIYPIFLVWQTGFFETAQNVIEAAGRRLLGLERAPAGGGVLQVLRERLDSSFEWSARQFGVKAIWEDMKSRAELASRKQGTLALAAHCISEARANLKVHLIGHSAGAILHGHFVGALARLRAPVESCHLWAPACTVEFATQTFGAAIAGGILPAEQLFIEVLSDANERGHDTVPGLYSKSLLYLISRGLEPEHKTPILGLEMTLPARREAAALQDVFSAEAIAGVRHWNEVARGLVYGATIAAPVVPTRLIDGQADTIEADHGSFDNSLDSFNRAIAAILGANPPLPAMDLTGY
jgi:hypothetical protein